MPPPQPSSSASFSNPDQKSSRVSDLPPYGLHGLGSTASLVGMLKAAALNPYETHDEGLADDPDPWQPSPNLNAQSPALLADNESDDGSNTEEEYLLTSTRPPHPQSLIQDASALDYPTKQHLDGLARQLIGHQTRCAELAIKNRHPSPLGVLPGPASSQTSSARTITRDPSPPATLSESTKAQIASLAQLEREVEETSNTPTEPNLTPEDRLRLLEEQFGTWTGLDARGQPEAETWIDQVPGVLYRSVIVRGVIALTNRRLCYLAYLPIMDNGKLIRSGTATYKSETRFFKRQRRWIELRTDSVTDYRSSTKLFRPLSSLHLSDIKRILPISPAEPRTLSFRLVDDHLIHLEFDTAESTALWHRDFVGALFSFKTNYSNQIKLSLPLRRIRKLQRENFDNIAKMMSFDLDFGTLVPYCHDGMEALYQGVVEEDSSKVYHHRLQLAYLLFNDPFDETVIDAIVRAKLELTRTQEPTAQSSRAHYTPSPVFEVLEAGEPPPEAEESEENEQPNESRGMTNLGALARGFVKAFGLKADQKLYICPCSLVRTLPAFGNMALSDDYLCFWRRVMMIGQDLKLRIPLIDIGLVSEASAFGFTRFGLAFEIAGAADIRLDFSSAAARDESMKALRCAVDLARARANRRQSSLPSQSTNPLGQMPMQGPQISLSTDQIKTLPAIISNVQLNQTVRPLRVVCMTIGSRGDVQPYISLAKQLQKDGHTVTIASHPEYRSWVESFGILYKDVGGDPGALMKLSVEHSFFSAGFFKEGLGHFRKWLDDLFNEAWLACKESDAELLIESPSTFSGIHIAEALRIPYFRAFTMTWTSTSTYPQAFAATVDLGPHYNLVSYMLFDNLIWRAMAGQVNRWRKHTLGIPPTSLEKMQPYKVPFLYNFSSAVVPKPLDWRDHISVTGYWFLDQSHGDYKAPEDLTTFIAKARSDGVPLIYVGFGSVTVPDAAAVTKAIYGAVVAAGVRAVVAKGWSERVSLETAEAVEVPPEVFVLQSVPHDWLFPQLDAVCHHGGAGTTGISLRFGLPTLIHPFFGDQMFWADRVTRLGAGMRVESLSMSCLAGAFGKATKDRVMKEKAGQVGERIRAEDGPRTAAEFIYRHLDFALERTEHRIERTAMKRARLYLVPGDKNPNTVDDVL
ncbi:hypothetical protein CROQUDRAFT_56856 [Cronartium quercuum f. sp. fusiforme G11]|uniref:sterol 3beta-glucosyltransferase n=1 Tax=Cronartium quercuum f. sp. fusiforme G11 TaxID=708437 RepID=A0A9P6NQP9_9BASI|nr:hypothetical protein CROQUDRAFT_56856 [Cronartium quercuum f. sp. fusiforme G11]